MHNIIKQVNKSDKDFHIFTVNFLKNLDKLSIKSGLKVLLENFSYYLALKDEEMHLFSVSPQPYLEQEPNKKYTLVLDLDETLVHYFESPSGGSFMIRPYCIQFLENVSQLYEIVVFTAAMQDYANWVIDNLDPLNKLIRHRLFRQHTIKMDNVHIKDLSRIGREMNKIIIIDNVADNF